MAEKKEKKLVAASEESKLARDMKQQQSEEEAPVRKKQAAPVDPGKAKGLRIWAVVLWLVAFALELCALLVFLGKLDLKFVGQMAQLIGFLVLDFAACVAAAQLWKKANHLDPVSEENKFKFWLWNNMGLVALAFCFFPFIIMVLTNKKADKRTKTIATIAAVICLALGGLISYDWNPVSSEMKEAAVQALQGETVYWSTFGKVYHTHQDCPHLNRSEQLTYGSVEEAIANNRVRLCKTCAKEDGINGVALDE